GPARVVLAQRADRVDRGLDRLDRDRVRDGPERRSEGLLVARGHVQEGRERAERPLRARALERARAVLAGQTQLVRLDPRGEGRTVPLGRLELALELGDALACGLAALTRLLVVLVEVLLPLLVARDLGLEGREVLRGAVSALLGLGEGRSQPAHLGLGRLEARTLRGDLTCEPGKSLA